MIFDDEMHDERTTGDLLAELEVDYRRCYGQIIKRLDEGERDERGNVYVDDDFEARQFIRTAFAYIEGATFVIKIEASYNSEEKGFELSLQQQSLIFEIDFDLNDKGDVIERPSKIPLTKNIRFAFSVFAQANGIKSTLDISAEWWAKLKESIKVRNRLMHPRYPVDLDVSPQEVIAMIKAKSGFDDALHSLIKARKAE